MRLAAIFSLVYLLAATIAVAAVAVIWPRRAAPGGTPLALMLLAAAVWAVCDAIELQLSTVAGKQLISQIQYIGVIAAAPCFFHAAMALSGRLERMAPGLIAAVWGVPVASLLIAWTNPWHNWLWTGIVLPARDLPFTRYEYGWWFWVLTAQHYLLMAAATLLLLGAIRRVRRPFRTGMTAVLVAVILPWIGNAAYIAKTGPWPGLDWVALSLGVTGSLLVWVVLREGLLDLLPRAREALLDKMTDGVLVLDRDGHVFIANQAARTTLFLDGPSLAQALGLASLSQAPEQWRTEAQIGSGPSRRWLDVRIDPIRDRWGTLAGRLVVARDVTFQKALEDEREHLIDELQDALKKVVQLEGLLPICASCRKVRDDGGYWGNVEEYFGSRAPVEFTHAICPDCEQKLYPTIVNT
jgi:PAS domain-containing protein